MKHAGKLFIFVFVHMIIKQEVLSFKVEEDCTYTLLDVVSLGGRTFLDLGSVLTGAKVNSMASFDNIFMGNDTLVSLLLELQFTLNFRITFLLYQRHYQFCCFCHI